MLAFIIKILKWFPVGLAGVIGIAQTIVKFIKEVLTLIVDMLFPIIPIKKFKIVVQKTRDLVNILDKWLENVKIVFLKAIA